MTDWTAFYGPNAGYAEELYERYLSNPSSVDSQTRAIFDQLGPPNEPNGARMTGNGRQPAATAVAVAERPQMSSYAIDKIVMVARLARSIREYGHLAADINPLGLPRPGDPMLEESTHGLNDEILASLPGSIVFPDEGEAAGSALDAINRLRAMYMGPIGYEFDHLQSYEQRTWLHQQVERGVFALDLSLEEQRELLERLTQIEGFERFLHTTFQGQKRFSIEGLDTLVLVLDEIVSDGAEQGVEEVLVGMSHRGRLNVLAHVLGKPYSAIFAEFQSAPNKDLVPSEGSTGINAGWTGDVKYHLGARRVLHKGETKTVRIALANNPSHLEYVNPTVEGTARAAQDSRSQPGAPRQNPDRAFAVTVHGDAAFPGEGVVAETLNLSRLAGYDTCGTLHVIANNQIGFTTRPDQGRSTLYASDLARGFEIPIIHVNADYPEAVLSVARLALAFRQRFHQDVLIDLVGYRRLGHNESDEPAFTQPMLYDRVRNHPSARALYAEQLIRNGAVTPDQEKAMMAEYLARLQGEREGAERETPEAVVESPLSLADVDTAVPAEELRAINEALLARPDGISGHPRVERLIGRRRESIERPGGIDWGHAEALAFGSILAGGTPIRLSGQDTERGTFSQRHLVLHNPETGATYAPLQHIPQARASFAVYNSPLSEAAALGFEYGYSVHAPDALVLWEAQYGDFANAGQVLIDQFIVSARAKWLQLPALTLLLPHGYEGQGPEHSSARLERYLQLAAEDNVRISVPSTAGQYFHLLRLQALTLATARRPLIILTPKSLLRNPAASSSLDDLANSAFQSVIEHETSDPGAVERLILATGKITLAIDLELADQSIPRVTAARVELLYPFPAGELKRTIARYPNLREIFWVQEEPQNMGAWLYIEPRLRAILPPKVTFGYIGRPERAAPAEGSPVAHAQEEKRILSAAFARGHEEEKHG